jgi:hypothetical protein
MASTFGRIIGPFRLASRWALVQNLPNIDNPGDEPRGSAALNPSAPRAMIPKSGYRFSGKIMLEL